MLYGSSTLTDAPSAPVTGSIAVTVPAPLLSTQSCVRSYDGTTCCGTAPVLNVRTTVYVAGSMTLTVPDREFGTYTSGRAFAAIGESALAPVAA